MPRELIGAINLLEGKGFNAATLAVALLALVAGACSAYFAWRTIAPRRRLTLEILPPAALVNRRAAMPDVDLVHHGKHLQNPYVVSLTLRNSGRAAIGSDQFDSGRPITVDLGVPIISLLSIEGAAGSRSGFAHQILDGSVSLGPDLLKPNEAVAMQVLVEGRPDSDISVNDYLRDAHLEYLRPGRPALPPDARRRRRANILTSAASILVILAGASIVTGTYLYDATEGSIRLSEPIGKDGAVHIIGKGFFPYLEVEFGFVSPDQVDEAREYEDLGSAITSDRPGRDGVVTAKMTVPQNSSRVLVFARQGGHGAIIKVR